MEHYVTLFDSLFLPQGLALHASMQRHADSYTLWVLCMDNTAYEVLQRLMLPNVRLLQLEQLETDALKRVKIGRSRVEYCWTLTPFTPRFVFDADPTVTRVTYVDADMWLRKSPTRIFQELEVSEKLVLITDHGYAPEYDQSATSGQYCVQFMTFCREGSEIVRKWWEERCIEWCYGRIEDGKFGDQKYLDDWTERFPDKVHVLQHQEWMLAPWNSIRFPYNGAILHHFHGLRIVDESKCVLGEYSIPLVVLEYIYKPYLTDLKAASALLKNIGYKMLPQHGIIYRSKAEKIKEQINCFLASKWRYAPTQTLEW